jgi:DNA-binding Lrp family transcriptional regulator
MFRERNFRDRIMAKTSKEQIQLDQIKVLDALDRLSKENSDEIAKSCGFSRQKVSRIIKDLEKNKVIWGYTAITDDTARNLKHFILLIKRNAIPFDETFKKELIFDKLDNYSSNVKVENLYLIHGRYDGVATFYTKDLLSAKRLVDEMFIRIGKYFNDYLLFETLVPIRKQGIKNPKLKQLANYL